MGLDVAKQARKMRDRAVSAAMKRKEEYLGARVPKELKERVISKADELGIPVSLLIRKVLEETFQQGNENSLNALSVTTKETPVSVTDKQDPFENILGWKTIEINQPYQCDRCGTGIDAGKEAVLGISAKSDKTVILCRPCKELLRSY